MSNSIESALRGHIADGVELLRGENGLAAYDHFLSYGEVSGLEGLQVSYGMAFPITELQTEEELVFNASEVARHSRANMYGAEIGGWHNGTWSSILGDSTKYQPLLVHRFYQEAGIVAAEEWLHILQEATGKPVAGHQDKEVDVAAYFTEEGLALSADFITRYFARAGWGIETFPDREDELTTFAAKFGRTIMSSEV